MSCCGIGLAGILGQVPALDTVLQTGKSTVSFFVDRTPDAYQAYSTAGGGFDGFLATLPIFTRNTVQQGAAVGQVRPQAPGFIASLASRWNAATIPEKALFAAGAYGAYRLARRAFK